VEYQDEYGSSIEAKELTKGVFRHKKDGRIDSMAAKIILERYLGYSKGRNTQIEVTKRVKFTKYNS